MFHVELRQRRNVARAFNLSEEELRAQFLGPLFGGKPFDYAGHEWHGREARVQIFEGRELTASELMLGRGWSNAGKYGTEVTERFLEGARTASEHREIVQRLRERILGRIVAGPLELGSALILSDDLLAGRAAADRLQATAEAAWELLHLGQAELLDADDAPVARDRWQPLLLAWASPTADQATSSSIRIARSASDANR